MSQESYLKAAKQITAGILEQCSEPLTNKMSKSPLHRLISLRPVRGLQRHMKSKMGEKGCCPSTDAPDYTR